MSLFINENSLKEKNWEQIPSFKSGFFMTSLYKLHVYPLISFDIGLDGAFKK